MKPHKRLMASLRAHGVAPGQRRGRLKVGTFGRTTSPVFVEMAGAPLGAAHVALAGHTHNIQQLPKLPGVLVVDDRPHFDRDAVFAEVSRSNVRMSAMNRAERRKLLFSIQKSAEEIVDRMPIPVSVWLQSQPGSTRRGYARGRFILPKNVFV